MRLIDLMESYPITTNVMDLEEPVRERVLSAFAELAKSQRGRPEVLATSPKANPGLYHATGLFTYDAEHVGDLTHRMSEEHVESMNFGYGAVKEKVFRVLRHMRNGYGYERQVQLNLQNNYRVQVEDGKFEGSFEIYVEEFKSAAALYASAHSKLVVYNEAQWHARQAAVSLGNLRYHTTERHITALERHLNNPEEWSKFAGTVTVDGSGNPVPYEK